MPDAPRIADDLFELPTGAPVLIDIEGTNTDPSCHAAPYVLDPNRPRVPDLTFGDGPHACIGAQLAQLGPRRGRRAPRGLPGARLAVPFDQLERDGRGTQSRRLASLPTWLGACCCGNS